MRFAALLLILASVATASETVRDGNWSDPAVWDSPPTRADVATIKHDVTVDSHSEALAATVESGATLEVASVLELWGSLVVNGTLEGTIGEIRFHVADDRSFTGNGPAGPDPKNPDFHPEDIGLWGMGQIHIHAPEMTSWLNAIPVSNSPNSQKFGTSFLPSIVGSSAILESIPTGWSIGDTLCVCGIDGSYQIASLTAINGPQIQFSTPFTADTLVATDVSGMLLYARPKVANLSRRFVISSADVIDGDSTHRAHVAVMMGGCAQFDFVEFRNLGPRKKLGRYPIHFHKMGDSPCCYAEGCSIWQSVAEPGNRFISVHDSSGIKVTNNVGLRSRGHGFFSETGNEANNEWTGNLSIEVSSPEELTVKNGRTDSGSHHFWLYDGSTISGNTAVGPKTSIGTVVQPFKATIGLILQHNSTGKAGLPPPVITDFESLGSGEYGAWSLVSGTKFIRPISVDCGAQWNHDTGFPPIPMTIENPLFAFNGVGGTSSYRCQLYFNSGIVCAHIATISGGVMVGDILLHAHYHAIANFSNVKFAGEHLVSPAYWQTMLLLTDCTFDVNQLEFHQNYLTHQEEPGLLRVSGGSGKIGSSVLSEPVTDFSLNTNARFPDFGGSPEGPNSIRLTSPAPRTGLIARPPTGEKYTSAEQWSVVKFGTVPGIFRQGDPIRFVQGQWQASIDAGTDGYPYGFPPGVYDVRIVQKDKSVKLFSGVNVEAGKVTQLQ